jgi:hypothetical protein
MGTIDYAAGTINLIEFAPTGTGTLTYIRVNVVPDQRYDIVPKRNQILVIDPNISDAVNIQFQDISVRKV